MSARVIELLERLHRAQEMSSDQIQAVRDLAKRSLEILFIDPPENLTHEAHRTLN